MSDPVTASGEQEHQPFELKNTVKELFLLFFRGIGFHLLSRSKTISFLAPCQIAVNARNQLYLLAVENRVGPGRWIFPERNISNDPAYVWKCNRKTSGDFISAYGYVVTGNKVLCPDFGHNGFYKGFLSLKKRRIQRVHTVIILSSQFQDEITFGGYYDYVLLVAAKLCRIKDALPPGEFAEATVSYPLFDKPYEQEYLGLLGVESSHIADSREVKIHYEQVILGNSGHWFYPNISDILSLKKHIEQKLNPVKTASNRIYISRAGRRRVSNEEELIVLLKTFGFEVIDDKTRPVKEQVAIYKNASFIIGPHGASFTNIIWCDPGTHLLELFSPNYVPDFFVYIAKIMGMQYSAYVHGIPGDILSIKDTLVEDIYVSIPEINRLLISLLG